MYKLIIADDEKFILDSISTCVDWEALGFEIVASCTDGEQVIEYLDSIPVDAVLTDIRMGYITGIEIAKFISESHLPCKIVFISAYKDFEFARQGMKYGVEDYILKPSKVEDLEQTFKKIRQSLDECNRDAQQRQDVENRWNEIRPVLEETLFNDLIMGAITDKKSIEQRMRLIYPEIDTFSAPCFFSNLEINNYHVFLENQSDFGAAQLGEEIYDFVNSFRGNYTFGLIYKAQGKIKMLSIAKESMHSKQADTAIFQETLDLFIKEFEGRFCVKVSTSMEYFENIYAILDRHAYWGSSHGDKSGLETHILEQKKLILANILQGNIGAAQRIMQNMVSKLGAESIRYRNHCLVDLWSNISDCLRENNAAAFAQISPYINYLNILNLNSEASILTYCNRIFDKMRASIHMSGNYNMSDMLNRITNYVQTHIFEDIQIEDLSSTFFISPPHLRRIIKQQTGGTFLQFITNLKMAQAAETLRNPEYKIYEISEKLGYKTTRYFSKLFYSYSGFYPSQYRKEVLGIGGIEQDE